MSTYHDRPARPLRRFREEQLRELRDLVDIVEIAGRYTDLKRSGPQMVGLCPLHQERTPSFFVHRERGWKCFGCGAGGDVIDLVQQLEGWDFPRTVRWLADQVGYRLHVVLPPERTDTEITSL